jgi:cytoskeletal protein CcmA (bactofilin family)
MWATLLLCSTALIFALPLAPALQELRRKTDANPLHIDQEHAGDVRHFARRFVFLLERELPTLRPRTGRQDPEDYAVTGAGAFQALEEEQRTRVSARVLVAEGPLELPSGFSWTREVYGRGDVRGGSDARFRAVIAGGRLVLGPRADVLRWAHARSVHALADCVLLGRLSADEEVVLEPGCQFARVNAPRIVFGSVAVPGAIDRDDQRLCRLARAPSTTGPRASALAAGRWLSKGDLEIPAGEVFRGDLVVQGHLVIHRGAGIDGSIKAHGDVRLDPGVSVTGAVVSTRSISAVGRCTLGGPVLSEREVRLGAGSVVGALGAPATVAAPVIRIEPGVVVHGTVWARDDGRLSFADFVTA